MKYRAGFALFVFTLEAWYSVLCCFITYRLYVAHEIKKNPARSPLELALFPTHLQGFFV